MNSPHPKDRKDNRKLDRGSRDLQAGDPERSLSELLDYTDLAKITRKSIITLRRYKMLGCGPPFIQIGRHIRFRKEDVVDWLNSLAAATAGAKQLRRDGT
jgi:hypothetical protein